jgi:hypothetical protein
VNNANEKALRLARAGEFLTRGRLRAWTVRSIDGQKALIHLSYIKEGEIDATVICLDVCGRADLDMVADHMNGQAGVGNHVVDGLTNIYGMRAPMDSMLAVTSSGVVPPITQSRH